MQSLIKTCALPIVLLSLTACGGGGGDSKPAPSPVPSSAAASSVAPSSTPASSVAASSIAPVSSSALSSSTASSTAVLTESTNTPVTYTNYSVATIDNCGQGIAAGDKTFAIFADYDGGAQNQSLATLNFSGWNHTTNGSTSEWANLKKAGTTYNFSTTANAADSCNGVDSINIVLVKKIADWDRQHSNGFERNILAHGYKFGDIENLVVDIKVNSANTSIPSVASLKTTYASYVSAATVDALDEGKVNVDITLHDGANLFGKIIVQLDQEALKDQWVRVTVPMSKVNFYQEINYNRTTKTLADMSNVVIQRMLIVGETKKGTVLRGDINPWSTSVPETFKEMDLSFKKIEFQLK
ncbi:MAG: hypothetical protein Q7T48_03340 [Cellvibrio sp.]|uniref:hypothetical protein n=1 Tax=Cellvibrio sp. TaxID=1965322 RepID=UPI002717216F|nr:hypothetical protein [Cellvibrio sp.]